MKLIGSIKEYGLLNFIYRLSEKIQEKYIQTNDIPYINKIENYNFDIMHKPMISIVVPIYNTPRVFLEEMIESVLNQTYDNFQLCLLNGGSTNDEIDAIIRNYALRDNRITYLRQEVNEGIAKNTNNAIQMAKGEFIALLDHDDLLTEDALMECIKVINQLNPDIIYSDEDKVSSDGGRFLQPHFKPDWSPDTLKSYNYICHLLVVRSEVLRKVNLFREGVDGSQDYDLILRLSMLTNSIVHIPKILYHWRINENSTAGNSLNKSYAFYAGKKALENYFNEIEITAAISKGSFPGSYDIKYGSLSLDMNVMIIIVGEWELEKEIVEYYNIFKDSIQWKNFNIYIINKLKHQGKRTVREVPNNNLIILNTHNFIREINDLVSENQEEYIFIVDSDIKITNKSWIDIMLAHSQNSNTVIIGPKLTNKNKIYSYGLAIIKDQIINIHQGKHRRHFGYFGRARISQNITAASPELIMFKKSFFELVGGFEQEYEGFVAILDLCLKAKKANKYVKLIPMELGECNNKNKRRIFSERDLKLFFETNKETIAETDSYFPIEKAARNKHKHNN